MVCGMQEGFRAKNGTRTRDPDLGKVVLYQLSYFRVGYKRRFPDCDAKVGIILEPTKFFEIFFQLFSAHAAPETALNAENALCFNAFHAVKIVADFRACFIINIDDRVAFLSRIYSCNEETYRKHVTEEQEERRPRHGKLTT